MKNPPSEEWGRTEDKSGERMGEGVSEPKEFCGRRHQYKFPEEAWR